MFRLGVIEHTVGELNFFYYTGRRLVDESGDVYVLYSNRVDNDESVWYYFHRENDKYKRHCVSILLSGMKMIDDGESDFRWLE